MKSGKDTSKLFQATDVLMCIVDNDGKFLFANQNSSNFMDTRMKKSFRLDHFTDL